ncbi:MAG: DsbC family protein [Pseudomonadota bacterium]
MNASTLTRILTLMGFFFSATVYADAEAVKKAITKAMQGVVPDEVTPSSEVPGLYEVLVGPNMFYVSEDGRYLVQGKMIDIEARKDLTEPKVAKARANAIKKVGKDKIITFAAKAPKYTVSVFTDIDCGYCRKLHSEIDQYLAEGITIQYLFFPRAGVDSPSYDKAVSVWCAKDRNDSLTKAKKGTDPEAKTCDNPVKDHMALGTALGAKGTPMLVTGKGSVFPGYIPAKQLKQLLDNELGQE